MNEENNNVETPQEQQPNPFFNHTKKQDDTTPEEQTPLNEPKFINNKPNNNAQLPINESLGRKNNVPLPTPNNSNNNEQNNNNNNDTKDNKENKDNKDNKTSQDKNDKKPIEDKNKNNDKDKQKTSSIGQKISNGIKNTNQRVGNSIKNNQNLSNDDNPESQEEQQQISNIKNSVGNATKKVGKTLLKIFMMLPLTVKLLILIFVLVLFLILFLFMILGGGSGVDYEDESIYNITVSDGETSLTVGNFIKSVIAKNYYTEDDDFLAAFTIYASSIIYSNYDEDEPFPKEEYFNEFEYDVDFEPPLVCQYLFEENFTTESSEDAPESEKDNEDFDICIDGLRAREIKFPIDDYDELTEEDIIDRYRYLTVIDQYLGNYIEEPGEDLTKALADKMIELANQGKTYEEILAAIENVETTDIEIGRLENAGGGVIGGSSGVVQGVRDTAPGPGNPFYPLKKKWNFQCVWYASNRAKEILTTNGRADKVPFIDEVHGNGDDWNPTNNAVLRTQFANDPTCTNFKAGSIISWEGKGANAEFGHVAIVEKVEIENGLIYISEGWNNNGGGYASEIDEDWKHFEFRYRAMSIENAKNNYGTSNGKCLGLTYLLD